MQGGSIGRFIEIVDAADMDPDMCSIMARCPCLMAGTPCRYIRIELRLTVGGKEYTLKDNSITKETYL